MGTPSGPSLANIYLLYYEKQYNVPGDSRVLLYQRYIDDVLLIFNGTAPEAIEYFNIATSNQVGITWDIEKPALSVSYLDLNISISEDTVNTSTHQKKLNLYLYVPSASAHPPGLLRGMTKGLVLKFQRQNTTAADVKRLSRLLMHRLHDRGYGTEQLLDAYTTSQHTNTRSDKPSIYLPIRYTGLNIRKLLPIADLERALKLKIGIAYKKSANIGDLVNKKKHQTPPKL